MLALLLDGYYIFDSYCLPGDIRCRLSGDMIYCLPGDIRCCLLGDMIYCLPGDIRYCLLGDMIYCLPGDIRCCLLGDMIYCLPDDNRYCLPGDIRYCLYQVILDLVSYNEVTIRRLIDDKFTQPGIGIVSEVDNTVQLKPLFV